jgi:S1-C subfamily serine protease
MSTVDGQYGPYDPAQPPPPPPPPMWQPPTWQQAGWPAGFGGPAEESAEQYAGGPRKKRRRRVVFAAGALAVALAAGGTAWATVGASSGPLTTAAIASKVDPGIVDITSTLGYQATTAEGTGMVLTSSGEVLTNNHVIEGATAIKATDVGNGQTYTAKVVGYDSTDDVAVLQLQGASGLATVSLGSSSGLAAGQKVVALGNALGKGGTPAVATGSITGLGQAITAEDDSGAAEHLTDMIQTNAPIERGDSGGPLVNSSGQVIGMDTAASSGGSGQFGTTAATATQAFSIPINKALSIASQIEAGNASATVHIGATAFLGVEVGSSSAGYGQAAQGVPVEGALQGTPAAAAGLSQGDTILAVGGHQVTSASDLESVMERYHPGDKVSVQWADQYGQTHTSTLTLTNGPAD